MGRANTRGFCQFIVGGCALLVVGALLLVGGVGYLYYRHAHPHPQVAPTPTVTASPTPATLATPTLVWAGQLDCRGKHVPVSDYSGVCFVGSLDLAKLLTPAELERVQRRDGGLFLDGRPVGQVVTLQGVEMVPIDPLLPTLGLALNIDETSHTVKAGAPAATATPEPASPR